MEYRLNYGPPNLKSKCQKDSRAYDTLAEAETSFAATLGSDTTTTTEEQSWGRGEALLM